MLVEPLSAQGAAALVSAFQSFFFPFSLHDLFVACFTLFDFHLLSAISSRCTFEFQVLGMQGSAAL
jgi:hypothetical protein